MNTLRGRKSTVKRVLAESLEARLLMTTLFWDATAAAQTMAANGYCELAAKNWTTDPSGVGIAQSAAPGDDLVFANAQLTGGPYVIKAGTTLNVSGNMTVVATLLLIEKGASLHWDGGQMTVTPGAAVMNYGEVDFHNTQLTIQTESGTVPTSWGEFFNAGNVNWTGGKLVLEGNLNNVGSFRFNGGALTGHGNFFNNGELHLDGGLLAMDGELFNQGTLTGGGSNLTVNGGFYNRGIVNWNAGNLDMNGSLVNESWNDGSTANPQADAVINLNGGVLTVESGASLSNSGMFGLPGTININGGIFIAMAGSDLGNQDSFALVVNSQTIQSDPTADANWFGDLVAAQAAAAPSDASDVLITQDGLAPDSGGVDAPVDSTDAAILADQDQPSDAGLDPTLLALTNPLGDQGLVITTF